MIVSKIIGKIIGILGGSGLYDLEGLSDVREQTVATPFGAPSAPLIDRIRR